MYRALKRTTAATLLLLSVLMAFALPWHAWSTAALPDYGTSVALSNGAISQPEAQQAFLAAYQHGRLGQWHVVDYTTEGDPITYTVRYQQGWTPIRLEIDTRQDHFGPRKVDIYNCQRITAATNLGLQVVGCWMVPGGEVPIP
jgi:hypothetical protein